MKYIDKALECVEKVCAAIAAVLLLWMLFALSVQVIARYIFGTGFAWTEESTRYAMIWMVFIGAVVCTKKGSHVVVDALEEFIPKLVPVLKVIQYIITLIYCGVVCMYSAQNLANAAKQTSPNIKIPMNYLHMVFPISMILIMLYTLRHLIGLFRHEKYSEGADEITQALENVAKETKGGEL